MELVSDAALQMVAEWANHPDYFGERIGSALVHRAHAENVFVGRIDRVEGGAENEFIGAYHIPVEHPFFFEHKLDHVPGLMILEASRQAAEAVSYVYFGVPVEANLILSGLDVSFGRFAELNRPLLGVGRVQNVVRRRGAVTRLEAHTTVIQDGNSVACLHGQWLVLSRQLYARVSESVRHLATADAGETT